MYRESSVPHEEVGNWDFHKLSVSNRIQSEILASIEDEQKRAEWALKNGGEIRSIMDSDSTFQECIDRRDWDGAKKVIIDRVPLPKQAAVVENKEKAA